jgi:hypothetical protein
VGIGKRVPEPERPNAGFLFQPDVPPVGSSQHRACQRCIATAAATTTRIEASIAYPDAAHTARATGCHRRVLRHDTSSTSFCGSSTFAVHPARRVAEASRAAVGSSRGEVAEEGQGKRYRRDVPVVVRKMGGDTHGFEVLGPR